ncbi:MAG: Holliday junction branch migration protein RuvA [Nitriliruptorales bacterium]|nr:Holliday junction branch migration protein RuvA [Nitriliruptorales bacterium]
MIALLRGRVAAATLGQVVLDVHGVGYVVRIPPGSAPGSPGEEITLHTHLAVREDAMTLYGFARASARDLFTVLLGVTGVGPKVALAALGTLGEDALRRAMVAEDVTALTVIPGVGRKSAQRMILELRERLGAPVDAGGVGIREEGGDPLVRPSPRVEVAEALSALGYAPLEVSRALDDLKITEDAVAEDLLRDVLRSIGGRAG